MTREKIENFREVILPFNRRVLLKIDYDGQGASDAEEFAKDFNEILNLAIKALEQESTTKNDLAVDAVSRKAVINQIFYSTDNSGDVVLGSALRERIARLPSVTPQEPQSFKWCETCKEYDQEKHCCHRYSKVIRDTVAEIRQEPFLDKINKMKSEIADSLEFWDYSPNNNPLARDMLETLTNFWGDIKAESEDKG